MSGVIFVRKFLVDHVPLTDIVPSARIMAGVLPLTILMPAISISMVSGTPWKTIKMLEPNRLYTDRIQVTAFVKNPQATPPGTGYPQLEQLLPLFRDACPNRSGPVAGITGLSLDSIIEDQEGPDLSDMTVGFTQRSLDFIVRYRRIA